MVVGHQEMQKEEREEIIRDKADRKRKKTLAKDLKPSTPSHGVRIKKNTDAHDVTAIILSKSSVARLNGKAAIAHLYRRLWQRK